MIPRSSLILPAPSRVISLSEAAGYGREPQAVVVDRRQWKSLLRREGRTADLQRMEKAEAKRKRKANR